MSRVSQEHIEVVNGENGPKARILGHRIRVMDVAIWHEELGMSVAQILEEYPTLTRGDVHAALAYYWDHRADIDRAIARERAFVAEFQQQAPGRLGRTVNRKLA